jgi:uncharacterized MnhB-related membrane protein
MRPSSKIWLRRSVNALIVFSVVPAGAADKMPAPAAEPTILSSNEFLSAIAGAIVGGLLTLAMQVVAARKDERLRAADRMEQKRALAASLLFKLVRIHSDFAAAINHFNGCITLMITRGDAIEPWGFYRPAANIPDRIRFSSEEMALVLNLREDETFNDLMPLDVAHASYVSALELLQSLLKALRSALPISEADEEKTTTILDPDTMLKHRPAMYEINILFDEIYNMAHEYSSRSDRVLRRVNDLFARELKTSTGVSMGKEVDFDLSVRQWRP